MTTRHIPRESLDAELPRTTPRDLARFVEEGRQWRAEEAGKLLRSLGRGLAHLGRVLAGAVRPTATHHVSTQAR